MMVTKISIERLREVLDYDPITGFFTWRMRRGKIAAGQRAGHMPKSLRKNGRLPYRQVTIDYVNIGEHVAAWAWMTGEWPPAGMFVDHENNDGSVNRWSNLRLLTVTHNTVRRGRLPYHKSTPYKGVTQANNNSKRFDAHIYANKTRYYLGRFDTTEQAKSAYDAAALRFHGVYGLGG